MIKFKLKKNISKTFFNLKKHKIVILSNYHKHTLQRYDDTFLIMLSLKRLFFLSHFTHKKKNLKTTSFIVFVLKHFIYANLRFLKHGKLYIYNNKLQKIVYRPNFMLIKGIRLYPKLLLKKKKVNKVKKVRTLSARLLFSMLLGLSVIKNKNRKIIGDKTKSKILVFTESLNTCLNVLNKCILIKIKWVMFYLYQ